MAWKGSLAEPRRISPRPPAARRFAHPLDSPRVETRYCAPSCSTGMTGSFWGSPERRPGTTRVLEPPIPNFIASGLKHAPGERGRLDVGHPASR